MKKSSSSTYSEHDVLVIIMIPWGKLACMPYSYLPCCIHEGSRRNNTKLTEYTNCWQSAADSAHNSSSLGCTAILPEETEITGLSSNTSGKYLESLWD